MHLLIGLQWSIWKIQHHLNQFLVSKRNRWESSYIPETLLSKYTVIFSCESKEVFLSLFLFFMEMLKKALHKSIANIGSPQEYPTIVYVDLEPQDRNRKRVWPDCWGTPTWHERLYFPRDWRGCRNPQGCRLKQPPVKQPACLPYMRKIPLPHSWEGLGSVKGSPGLKSELGLDSLPYPWGNVNNQHSSRHSLHKAYVGLKMSQHTCNKIMPHSQRCCAARKLYSPFLDHGVGHRGRDMVRADMSGRG